MRRRSFNHYEIVRKLGVGGSGIVYLANDTKLMRPVVLKMLHSAGASDEAAGIGARVLREARLASAIDHPNVCSIYEVDESDGKAVLVMQYVPGRTLARLVDAGPLSLQLALSIGIQIGDGLAEAHRLGILHRDLKPLNVMVTDGGLVKILDFGTARRIDPPLPASGSEPRSLPSALPSPGRRSGPRATLAYMAPELFVTGLCSVQTDVFAFGLILYELFTGKHPFLLNPGMAAQLERSIQYLDAPSPREHRPDIPSEAASVIQKALVKNPAERFASAAEMRDALRTAMRSLRFELGVVPGETSAVLPVPGQDGKRASGLFAMLTERFLRPSSSAIPSNTVLVLPFTDMGSGEETAFYGLALAEAVATRLARLSSLVVRAPSAVASVVPVSDPVEAGRRMATAHVVVGSFARSTNGFDLSWQLVDVAEGSVRTGGAISVPSLNLVAVQNEICDQVYAALDGQGRLDTNGAQARTVDLDEAVSEEYLQARATLSNFLFHSRRKEDLEAARERFATVVAKAREFAPAYAGLGVTYLQSVRHGFAGMSHLLEAQRCFQRALEKDASLVEANLHRVETLLTRGEKESARHGVHHLLRTAANDFEVHVVAGVILQRDGLYDEALAEFGAALRLNPAGATIVYNNRARVHHYQGQIELAQGEIRKGLALEPKHTLLRASLGYLFFRQKDTGQAIQTLEEVIADDPGLQMVYPTLAMCHVVAGDRDRAAALITDITFAAAEADCEMAYRLATYYALDGDTGEALHWLRRAIYLGNENYPWFARNPAWAKLRGESDLENILSGLKKTYRSNVRRWSRLFEQPRSGVGP